MALISKKAQKNKSNQKKSWKINIKKYISYQNVILCTKEEEEKKVKKMMMKEENVNSREKIKFAGFHEYLWWKKKHFNQKQSYQKWKFMMRNSFLKIQQFCGRKWKKMQMKVGFNIKRKKILFLTNTLFFPHFDISWTLYTVYLLSSLTKNISLYLQTSTYSYPVFFLSTLKKWWKTSRRREKSNKKRLSLMNNQQLEIEALK